MAALLVGLPGCVLPLGGEESTSLVLTYRLIDLRLADADYREANPGGHCATAYVRDGRLHVQRDALSEIGRARPILLVDPELEGRWSTLGTEGVPLGVPANVEADSDDVQDPVTRIAWDSDGNATVDGQAVSLPHEWTLTDPAGTWRIEARLAPGPSEIVTFPAFPCE